MHYKEFREKLAVSEWEEKIVLAIFGATSNVVTKYLNENLSMFQKLSLETIRIRFPDLYDVVREETSRDALVSNTRTL